MREILFRGRGISGFHSGEFVYGYFLKDFWEPGCCGIRPIDTEHYGGYVEVDVDTVGQYTGLTDKNGKKIFEGDIVKSVFNEQLYLVCFGEYAYTDEYDDEQNVCGWYNKDENCCVTGFGDPDAWAIVVGNIHDNPELLKGGDE